MERSERQVRVGREGPLTSLRRRVQQLPVKRRFLWWGLLQVPELLLFYAVFDLMVDIEFGGFTEPGPPGEFAGARLTFGFLTWLLVLGASVLLLWERTEPGVSREPVIAAVFGLAAGISHCVIIPPMTWWPLFFFTMAVYGVGLLRKAPMRGGAIAYLVLPVILVIVMIVMAVN